MSTTSLKTQLVILVELQKIDSEIYTLRSEKDAKPKEIKALEDAFEEKRQSLANIEKKSLDLQKQRKEIEIELSTKEESIKKLQVQLFQLKTNKEYQTMLKEIAGTKADASVIEDKVIQVLEQIDKTKVEVEDEKQRLQGEEKLLSGKKKNIENRIKEIDDRLIQLDAQRKEVMPGFDPKILAQYERILLNRDGLAIVSVNNDSCQGCNLHVPPQVINLIKMYERIVICEACNRILYISEATTEAER